MIADPKNTNLSRNRQRGPAVRSAVFYGGHDRKAHRLTPTQTSLLLPWIKRFTIIIAAKWNRASSKLKKSETKLYRKTRKQRQFLSESGFSEPLSLSRNRRIKMKKLSLSINASQSSVLSGYFSYG